MTILSDVEITDRCIKRVRLPILEDTLSEFTPMIFPFVENCVRQVDDTKVMSFGVSSFGYDVRLAEECKIFTNQNALCIDPKRIDEKCLVDATIYREEGETFVILPPNSYMLGRTIEHFHIPRDIMVVCLGKSTYARAGAIINVTPGEPGFRGNIVIEIANSTTLPMKIYLGEGIAQFLFLKGNPCKTSYADRSGKYQDQSGITLPRV